MESRGGEYASMYTHVWMRFEWTDGTRTACERERQLTVTTIGGPCSDANLDVFFGRHSWNNEWSTCIDGQKENKIKRKNKWKNKR